MKKRKKIYFISGIPNLKLAEEVTNASYERINVDHVFLSTAIKHPYLWQDNIETLISNWQNSIIDLLREIKQMGEHHLLLSEYCSLNETRPFDQIKAVEGHVLNEPWLKSILKTFHKKDAIVIDVFVNDEADLIIDGVKHSWVNGLDLIKSYSKI